MNFDVFEYSNKGGRSYNEDSVGSRYDQGGGIFVVADGLGGHLLGEEASATAVKTILSDWNFRAEDIKAQLNEKIVQANCNILQVQKEKNAILKTTVAALAITGTDMAWANSGDSRVYFIRGGKLQFCTNDHSVAFKKYKAFEITREQIATDEDQSRLLRTLGSEERYEPELYSGQSAPQPGDAFLLCTDGAWEYLKDEEIVIDCLKSENSQRWTELLLLRIMERIKGENDNLSLVTVKIL